MTSRFFEGTTALVTGASSGIGREIARLLASRVKRLVLVARREDRLRELSETLVQGNAGLDVRVMVCDLAQPSELDQLVQRLHREAIDVDLLVNNAGIGDMGVFDMASAAKLQRVIDLNVTSLTMLTYALLPKMVERKRGGILNISSGFGMAFLGGFAVYVATKHYVTGFSEALRADLKGTGVSVTQVCPGPVATEFEQGVGNPTGVWVPPMAEISAERCARAAVAGFEKKRAMVVPGMAMKVVLFVNNYSPRFMRRMVASISGSTIRKLQMQKNASKLSANGGG